MSKTMKKMTTKEMREMVGCQVTHRGRQATIESVRPDMQMMRLEFATGGSALVRPSELGDPVPAMDPRIEIHTVAATLKIDGEMLIERAGDLVLRACLVEDRFVFAGGAWGEHSLASDFRITSAARVLAHWRGYVENNRAWRAAS